MHLSQIFSCNATTLACGIRFFDCSGMDAWLPEATVQERQDGRIHSSTLSATDRSLINAVAFSAFGVLLQLETSALFFGRESVWKMLDS